MKPVKRRGRPKGTTGTVGYPNSGSFKPGNTIGFKPGAEWKGSPGGKPSRLKTFISDATNEWFATLDPKTKQTFATEYVNLLFGNALKQLKKGETLKEHIALYKDGRDTTEGKPLQKVELSTPNDADPLDELEQIIAEATDPEDTE